MFNPYTESNLHFQLEPGDLSALNDMLKMDTLNLAGIVSGQVKGKVIL